MNKDIRKYIKIDKYKLEREAANQSELFLYYAEQLPKLYKRKQKAKDKLEEVQSEIADKIRSNTNRYFSDDQRITDKAINDKVTIHPKVKRTKEKVIEAEVKFQRASNRVKAFDQRRSMIKYMVELYRDQYWSVDHISDEEALDIGFRKKMARKKKRRKKI